MKKIILISGMLCLFASAEATAEINVSVGLFGEPSPAYVEAPDYVQEPVYPTYVQEGAGYHRWHGHRGRGPRRDGGPRHGHDDHPHR